MTADEIDRIKLKYEGERIELEKRQMTFRLLGVLGACVAFGFSSYQYFDGRARETEARTTASQRESAARDAANVKDAETRRIEASKVFLERQLKSFEEAVKLTAKLAVLAPEERNAADIHRFWELYWGELAMVERGEVATAMVNFGELLRKQSAAASATNMASAPSGVEKQRAPAVEMGPAAIAVAHAVRAELARSWDIAEWKRL